MGVESGIVRILFCKQKTASGMRISDWSSDVCSSDLSAERIEAARDGRDEAPFAAAVGRNRPEQRRRALMGAVRATQSLDRRVGTPARLEQIVVAPRLIGGIQARMIAAAGAARIREDQAALGDRKSTRLNPVTNAHLVCRLLLEKKKRTI